MRVLIIILAVMCSTNSMAASDWGIFCSQISSLHAWQGGSDKYGLRITHVKTYPGCGGGYFIPHGGGNKSYVYSTALTAFTTNVEACVQIALVSDSVEEGLCKLNKIYLSK